MTTRGIRNNNPLNIRKGNNWVGEVKGNDASFETFQSMAYGYRAAIIILHKYYTDYGCNTIGKIISRWAPKNENNTRNYIATVSRRTKIPQGAKISWSESTICAIVSAMAFVENGIQANSNDVLEGWKLANKQ